MNRKAVSAFLSLGVILLFAFWLRFEAFWLPHWKGDQNQYVVLAMKLDKFGLGEYNLRGVRLGNSLASKNPPIELAFCKPADSLDEKGDLLRILEIVGQPYYDEPFHYRAPLFPYLLSMSHQLFAKDQKYYGVLSSNPGEAVKTIKPKVIFETQFWAAVVPIVFNLAVIALTFFFGWRFFGMGVGIAAAFLLTTNAVSLMLAHRLLVEDVLTFFMTLAVFLYLWGLEKRNRWLVLTAGFAAGFAILSKQTAGLIFAPIWVYTFLVEGRNKKGISRFFSVDFLIFFIGAIIVSSYWFYEVYKHYGNIIHQPTTLMSALRDDKTGWFRALGLRPSPLIFFSAGVLYLAPLFSCGLWTAPRLSKEKASTETMLWLWVFTFFIFVTEPWHILAFMANQEHRFFYMVYPALALLAGVGIEQIRSACKTRFLKTTWLVDGAIIGLFFLNACWGIHHAAKVIYSNNLLL